MPPPSAATRSPPVVPPACAAAPGWAPGQAAGPFQSECKPGHVVVVVVGPAAVVAGQLTADLPPDRLHPVGLGITDLGVDEGVQQMRLPPVVPGRKGLVLGRGRPAHHAELGAGNLPQPPKVPGRDGGLGTGRPVLPLLVHGRQSCPTKPRRSDHCLIQVCMAIPAATPALILRVDPGGRSRGSDRRRCAASEMPGPEPNSNNSPRGGGLLEPQSAGMLSTATTVSPAPRAKPSSSSVVS